MNPMNGLADRVAEVLKRARDEIGRGTMEEDECPESEHCRVCESQRPRRKLLADIDATLAQLKEPTP